MEVTHRRILRRLLPGLDPAAGHRDGGVAPGGGAAAGQAVLYCTVLYCTGGGAAAGKAVPRHECRQRHGYTGTLHRVLTLNI